MAAGGGDTRTFDHVGDVARYIIAIDTTSSRAIQLPSTGVLQIGRSRDAEIAIASDVVSRNHARLIVSEGAIQIEDLGSHNGTLVNGEPIVGTAALAAGDVVTIADTLLIVRGAGAASPARAVDMDELARRIEQELARAAEYDRPFCVVVLRVARPRVREAMATVIGAARTMDVVCQHVDSILVLCPELDVKAGHAHGVALLGALAEPDPRGGVASYPSDGCDAATLIPSRAASAALVAPPGQVSSTSTTSVEHRIGGNRVILADPAMVRLYDLIGRFAPATSRSDHRRDRHRQRVVAAALHHGRGARTGRSWRSTARRSPRRSSRASCSVTRRAPSPAPTTAKAGLARERATAAPLFLDEVGELPPAVQAKLLRALEARDHARRRRAKREVDVRVVAATNRDLDDEVAASGRSAPTSLPAQRVDDDCRRSAIAAEEIPLLARAFLHAAYGTPRTRRPRHLGGGARDARPSRIPGNVRELKNAIDYAVATAEGTSIQPWDFPAAECRHHARASRRGRPAQVQAGERGATRSSWSADGWIQALEAHDGVQTQAAAAIGMPLRTFTFRMRPVRIRGSAQTLR